MKLCSACLLGIKCCYDRNDKVNEKVVKLASTEVLIPVCPEQLGGLSTPRKPAEQKNDKVITEDDDDVTRSYMDGAEQVLNLAKMYNIKSVILKQRSPSCGCGKIYDGTFSGVVIDGDGITAKILKENNIEVLTEDDL